MWKFYIWKWIFASISSWSSLAVLKILTPVLVVLGPKIKMCLHSNPCLRFFLIGSMLVMYCAYFWIVSFHTNFISRQSFRQIKPFCWLSWIYWWENRNIKWELEARSISVLCDLFFTLFDQKLCLQVFWKLLFEVVVFFYLKGGLVKKLMESKKEQEAVQPKRTELVSDKRWQSQFLLTHLLTLKYAKHSASLCVCVCNVMCVI